MKRFFSIIVLCLIVLSGCNAQRNCLAELKINDVEEKFFKILDNEFGYCDVSEFYRKNYFSSVENITDIKIYTCNESTNFDEFGIVSFESEKAAKTAKKEFKKYLEKAKQDFKSGIVYDISEWPKFESARVECFNNLLIYGILNSDKIEEIFNEIDASA